VAVDASGNVILTGLFDGSVNFGSGAIAYGGPSDATFLTKIDPIGNTIWSIALDDSLDLGTNKLAVDAGENIFLANEFRSTVDLGGGPLVAQGFRDGVIAKFDPQGNNLWSKQFGGSGAQVLVEAAAVDVAGNLVVTGTFTGTVDFGGGATLVANPFATNMFVAKFNSAGTHVWSRRNTGGLIIITALTVDLAGNVIVTGYHGAAFDFGGGSIASDPYNVFLAKYSTSGDHLWSKSLGDPATYEYAYDVACDVYGNIAITGHFGSPFDLGGGALTSNGDYDAYVAKFDANGNHAWSTSFGGEFSERAYSVAMDGLGEVIACGHFQGSVDFGAGTVVADPIDYYGVRFDVDGNYLWSQRFDVYNFGVPNGKSYSIATAANLAGRMAFVGTFKDEVSCGAGPLGGFGGWDTFVVVFGGTATGIPDYSQSDSYLSAYPNPFNPSTTITYAVPQTGPVRLDLFDVRGSRIGTLADHTVSAGEYATTWDGRDHYGRVVASGVYFVRLQTANHVLTRRIVLLK